MNKLTKKARRNFDNCAELARCTRTWVSEKTTGGFSYLTSVKTSWPRATCTQTCEYMPPSSLFRLRTSTSSAEREHLQPETHSRRHPDTILYRLTNTRTYRLTCIRIACTHILTRTHEHDTLLDVHLYPHQHTDTGECTHTPTHTIYDLTKVGSLLCCLEHSPPPASPPRPAVQPQRLSGSWQPKPAGLLCGWHFYFGTKCNLSQVIERSTAITTVYPYRQPLLTSSSWQ